MGKTGIFKNVCEIINRHNKFKSDICDSLVHHGGTYSRRLIDGSYRIKPPIFGTYEDLEEIKKTFLMYEEFKKTLIKQ